MQHLCSFISFKHLNLLTASETCTGSGYKRLKVTVYRERGNGLQEPFGLQVTDCRKHG